jgi:hypothetical protein
MDKIKYVDPFLGEIELTKIGETSHNAVGETVVRTIYTDKWGNYYVSTWSTVDFMRENHMIVVLKEVANIIGDNVLTVNNISNVTIS